MNKTQVIVALGWGCSQFAAGMSAMDLTPLAANPAVIGLIALGLNTFGGMLYVLAGKKQV